MRLFDAILEANHRALAGDTEAGVRTVDFKVELPIAALTCIDVRLNAFFPGVMGLPKEEFIWLRNAGNIITGPMSSTMRSLALACAIKGAREIAIIGHTDCLVGKTSTMNLTDEFRALGVDRNELPQNLTEFFGLFASERQNVIKAVDFVRQSPLVGLEIPVHGLMVDINNGKLDWVVNGYQVLETMRSRGVPASKTADALEEAGSVAAGKTLGSHDAAGAFKFGELKFPEGKIGDINSGSHTVSAPMPATPVVVEQPRQAPPPRHYPEQQHSKPLPHAPLPMPGRKLPPPRIRGR